MEASCLAFQFPNEDRSGVPHTPFTADVLKVLPTGIGHAASEHYWMGL